MNLSKRLSRTFLGLSSVILVFPLVLAMSIRPIADDYCTGAGVSQGFWRYIYEISQTWSGDFSQIVIHAVLVGLPLANLPVNFLGFSTKLEHEFTNFATFSSQHFERPKG